MSCCVHESYSFTESSDQCFLIYLLLLFAIFGDNITLQSVSVCACCNIEKILKVSLLKRQRVEAFSLVTRKFRSKTLQKIASRLPHQIV